MQRYIKQLIDDIHKATWNVRPPHELWDDADPDYEVELEDMSFAEQYLYGEKEPVSQITGISQGQLPLPEKLSQEQQALLATELEKLLQYFHFTLDFPDKFPAHLRYPFIRDFWTESHVPLSFGENHIEFCDYEDENCPFPGYCSICDEVSAQMKYDEEHSSKTNLEIDIDGLLPSPEQMEAWMKQQENDEGETTGGEPFPFSIDENEGSYTEDINGFYDDDGNKIDLHSVPVPGLCIICENYQIDDWDENLLCLMNRNDQRNEADFKCGAFKKL